MESAADHYATLDVSPEADAATIRRAYRDLMRRYHPDVNATDEAAARAQAINEAYACLRDPDERAFYDRLREARAASASFTAGATPHYSPHASRHYSPRSTWRPQHAYAIVDEGEPPPRKWRFASLGLAALVTLVSFKITSYIPGIVLPPPEPVVVATTAVSAEVVNGAPAAPCQRPGVRATPTCGTPPASENQPPAQPR